ncbi:MAG: peptidoglycan DD-metalloendopeptidase family protein [Caldisericia bacterium]|nr:peptidoglycan DD-metalloendopeptidase family protein [Caldisericia bacterium]
MKKNILLIFLILLITFPQFIKADDDLEKEKKILNNLKSTLQNFEKKLNETISYKNTILGEIDNIESKIKDISLKISDLERKISDKKSQIEIIENNISLTQIEIEKDKELIGDKLFLIYKIKNELPLDIYFSSKSIGELFSRINFLNILLRSNRESLNELKEKENALLIEKEKLKNEKQNLESLLRENESLKTSLLEEEKKREELLKNLLSKESVYKKEIEVYKQKIEEQEEKIQEIIRKAELAKKLPEVGNIIWPVKGPIVSKFGMRIHPIYNQWLFHSGADIDAPTGTPIKAVADGIVIYAGWLGSYGIVVFLQHGGNITTVYAHMQYFTVEVNQYVKQGDIIGYVDNTGLSTGPHLHFEIRIDGKPVDPEKWLP